MAKHEIVISNPNVTVLSKDVEFSVKSDGKKLGTLLLSRGALEWVPAYNSVKRKRLSWEKFADMMSGEDVPTREKRPFRKTTAKATEG